MSSEPTIGSLQAELARRDAEDAVCAKLDRETIDNIRVLHAQLDAAHATLAAVTAWNTSVARSVIDGAPITLTHYPDLAEILVGTQAQVAVHTNRVIAANLRAASSFLYDEMGCSMIARRTARDLLLNEARKFEAAS